MGIPQRFMLCGQLFFLLTYRSKSVMIKFRIFTLSWRSHTMGPTIKRLMRLHHHDNGPYTDPYRYR